MHDTGQLTRAAVLLTLALIFQSLRLIIPLPPFIGVFLIGALVNAVLAFAAWRINLTYVLSFAAVLPCVAYLQGQLPLPIFIPLVVVGNWAYIFILYSFRNLDKRIYIAPLVKAGIMYFGTLLVLQFFSLPPVFQKTMGLIMGVAQLVTGFVGILLAKLAAKTIK